MGVRVRIEREHFAGHLLVRAVDEVGFVVQLGGHEAAAGAQNAKDLAKRELDFGHEDQNAIDAYAVERFIREIELSSFSELESNGKPAALRPAFALRDHRLAGIDARDGSSGAHALGDLPDVVPGA